MSASAINRVNPALSFVQACWEHKNPDQMRELASPDFTGELHEGNKKLAVWENIEQVIGVFKTFHWSLETANFLYNTTEDDQIIVTHQYKVSKIDANFDKKMTTIWKFTFDENGSKVRSFTFSLLQHAFPSKIAMSFVKACLEDKNPNQMRELVSRNFTGMCYRDTRKVADCENIEEMIGFFKTGAWLYEGADFNYSEIEGDRIFVTNKYKIPGIDSTTDQKVIHIWSFTFADNRSKICSLQLITENQATLAKSFVQACLEYKNPSQMCELASPKFTGECKERNEKLVYWENIYQMIGSFKSSLWNYMISDCSYSQVVDNKIRATFYYRAHKNHEIINRKVVTVWKFTFDENRSKVLSLEFNEISSYESTFRQIFLNKFLQ